MDSEPLCAASAIHDLASYLDQRDLDDCDKDSLLGDDPILWFTMMLMPTGAYSCETGRNGGLQ
jgi:hypothetical protein